MPFYGHISLLYKILTRESEKYSPLDTKEARIARCNAVLRAGVRFPVEAKDVYIIPYRPAHPACGDLSPGVKRPDREADDSPPSSPEGNTSEATLPRPKRLHSVMLN
jgi:hypothetical protein